MQQWLADLDQWAAARLSWLAERPRWAMAALVALCLALYLPGIATLPVTDRDEARFAQATKQMVETGNYIDIRFQEEPRYKKPIGIYWLQSVSVQALSPDDLTQIWAYRVPSLLGIILGVLLTWWTARPIFGRENALLAAGLVAAAVTLSLESRIAKSDAVLFATIMAMQGALARLYLVPGTGKRIAALFWVAIGAGILIKGPVAPALAVLTIGTIAIFDRDRAWLKGFHPLWGVPLMLAITLPWFIAIGVTSNWEFYRLAFGEDFLGKLQGGKEKHWGPPGFYFVVFWLFFWPASLIAPGGAALWLWRNRTDRKALFLLAWVVPFWIALELTPTKLPHYMLPLFPAIAMGVVWVLRGMLDGLIAPMRSYKHAVALWLFIACGLAVFLAFVLIWFKVPPSPWLVLMAPVYLALVIMTARAAWSGKFHAAFVTALASALLIYPAAFRLVLPSVDALWTSRQIAEVVTALRPCVNGRIATSFREPSAVFLLGTDTLLTDDNAVLANIVTVSKRSDYMGYTWIRTGVIDRPRPLVVRRHVLMEEAKRRIAAMPDAACIDGFNINGGKQVQLIVRVPGERETYTRCPIPERYRCPEGVK